MRIIILICLLFAGQFANGQGQPTALPQNTWNGKINLFAQYLQNDSGFFAARRDTNFIAKQAGLILVRTADTTLYISTGALTGRKWKGFGSAASSGGGGIYNAGWGLTGTSTFSVDSFSLATRARVKKQIDSLAVSIGLQRVTDVNPVTNNRIVIGGLYSVSSNSTYFTSRVNVATANTFASPARFVLSNPNGDSVVHNIRGVSPVNMAGNSEYSHDLPSAGGYFVKTVAGLSANSNGEIAAIVKKADSSINGGYYPYATNPKGYALYPTNLSSGTGYRWYTPALNAFRVLDVDGYSLIADSTFDSNGLSLSIDTSVIATQNFVNTNKAQLNVYQGSAGSIVFGSTADVYYFTGTNTTWYLPDGTTVPLGKIYYTKCKCVESVTIQVDGAAQTIYSTSSVSSYNLNVGEGAMFQWDGVHWSVVTKF